MDKNSVINKENVGILIDEFLEFINVDKRQLSTVLHMPNNLSRPMVMNMVKNVINSNDSLTTYAKECLGVKFKHQVIDRLSILTWYEFLKLKEFYFDFEYQVINLEEILEVEKLKLT